MIFLPENVYERANFLRNIIPDFLKHLPEFLFSLGNKQYDGTLQQSEFGERTLLLALFFSRTPQLLKTVILFPNLCKKKEYPYRANFTKLAARTWTILSKNEIQAKGFRMI